LIHFYKRVKNVSHEKEIETKDGVRKC